MSMSRDMHLSPRMALWLGLACCACLTSAVRPATHADAAAAVVVDADGPDVSGEEVHALQLLQAWQSIVPAKASRHPLQNSSAGTPAATGVAAALPGHHVHHAKFHILPQAINPPPITIGKAGGINLYTDGSTLNQAVRTFIYVGFLMFASLAILDWYRFYSLPTAASAPGGAAALLSSAGSETATETKASAPQADPELPEWSTLGLIALTSYRFYTGFLSATWLPYLLAMEGADLYKENQSLFMGLAKLIYGLTILTNPLFGLIGDRAVALSHGIGRRLFLRAGIVIAGLGIFVCVLADMYRYFYCFVFGILLWRVGEALNDVTTEALVPELVPQSQYAIASATKATSFLLGGVSGYVILIFMTDYHYTWLYWAYAVGMLIFAVPCQLLLSNDLPMTGKTSRQSDCWGTLLAKAYIAPAFIEGPFPKVCFAIFVFSFGTSPMFFLLLMIRDLVGTYDPVQLQEHFSTSSIIFFISAAVATVVGGLSDKLQKASSGSANGNVSPRSRVKDPAVLAQRLRTVVRVAAAYALICVFMPTVSFLKDHASRIWAFYVMALLMGYCFGSGFARFQDITWQVIPAGVDVANAMGFNIMCRLFGVGVGNFFAGLLLDYFMVADSESDYWYHRFDAGSAQMTQVYNASGYYCMCGLCAIVCTASGYICWNVAVGVERDLKAAPVPAA